MVDVPDGPGLLHGPVKETTSGTNRVWTFGSGLRTSVAKNSSGSEDLWLGETRGGNDVIVLDRTVQGYQERRGLTRVNIEGLVHLLHRMSSFHFDKYHCVALYPKINGGLCAHV